MARCTLAVAVLLVSMWAGCVVPAAPDGGEEPPSDAGVPFDAGRVVTRWPDASVMTDDGGLLIYGRGCVSPDLNKVIFIVDSRKPQWCAYISMRRWDGGFTPLFPAFEPPEDFKVDDARWGVCRDLEMPTTLDPDAIPLDDLSGPLSFPYVYEGRPRTYVFDGGIQMGSYGFRVNIYAGLVDDCKGN
jgi:hypothetical protein